MAAAVDSHEEEARSGSDRGGVSRTGWSPAEGWKRGPRGRESRRRRHIRKATRGGVPPPTALSCFLGRRPGSRACRQGTRMLTHGSNDGDYTSAVLLQSCQDSNGISGDYSLLSQADDHKASASNFVLP